MAVPEAYEILVVLEVKAASVQYQKLDVLEEAVVPHDVSILDVLAEAVVVHDALTLDEQEVVEEQYDVMAGAGAEVFALYRCNAISLLLA